MKLFHRFFLILLGFSLIPVAVMGAWMLSTRQAVRDNARLLHGRLAALAAGAADRTLDQMNQTLGVVQDLEIARGQEKVEIPALRRAAAGDPSVALISILDPAGMETQSLGDPEVFPNPARVDRSADPLVNEARKTGKLTIGSPIVGSGRTLVPVVHPLSDGRSLYIVYSLAGLSRKMKTFADGGSGRVLFVDAGGRPIPGIGDEPPAAGWRLPEGGDDDWWDRLPSPSGPWVAAAAPVEVLGWRAVSLQPRRDAYAESGAAAERAAVFLLTLLTIVAGGAFLLSKRLSQPLAALVAGAERVAGGDFSKPVPSLGWGELNALGKTFNAMAEKIRHYQALQVERLLEEKAKVDALVRNIPEGVLLVGAGDEILFANATAARALGFAEGAARSEQLARAPEIKRLVGAARVGRKRLESARIEISAPGSEEATTFACSALRVVREGREIGVLALMRDITVEVRLERMKDEFFHAVVHDLRGPITVIDGMVHFMRNLGLGEKETRYIDMARMASGRLAALITNILDIAQLESGSMRLSLGRVLGDAAIKTAVELNRVPADGKRVTIEAETSAVGELVGDARLLDRVLMNLVGNALKFTPPGGRIAVGAQAAGGDVEFFVRDTGPGIPKDKAEAVFEKFKQLDRDVAARSGYGLGLSICKKIVDMHGGRIWVESEEGKGSRFAFRIPRAGPSPLPAK